MSEGKRVCRFSAGIPSAVAAKLTLAKYGVENVDIVRADTRSEHPDNDRFVRECEEWFGKKVLTVASEEYRDIWDVFRRERFIVSHQGAKCRNVLKVIPMMNHFLPSWTLVFGYTTDKLDIQRAERLRAVSAEKMEFPLIERGLSRSDCHALIERAGIEEPMMYRLGFKNNNCLGCPKGGMGYWNRIRQHFPEEFERMAEIQRELGPGSGFLVRRGERITLDQLQPQDGNHETEEAFECSIMCALAEKDMAA